MTAALSRGLPALLLFWPTCALAQPTPTEDPAVALARVCLSEEGWENRVGCVAIARTMENIRSKGCTAKGVTQCEEGNETLLSAMRRMSKRVTGMVRALNDRQRWIQGLHRDAAKPRAWNDCTGSPECSGPWKLFRPRWLALLAFADSLLEGRKEPNPCEGHVLAWGSGDDHLFMARRNLGRERAGKRKLDPLRCAPEVTNVFYGFPRAARKAGS